LELKKINFSLKDFFEESSSNNESDDSCLLASICLINVIGFRQIFLSGFSSFDTSDSTKLLFLACLLSIDEEKDE
jgi:hypothetical protein